MKKILKFAPAVLLLASLAAAQQTRIYRDGGKWAQEISGSLTGAKNLRVKVDAGSVRIEGGSQSGINYTIHNRVNGSSEEDARRQFDSYKLTYYVRGDTAWIVSEWQGRGRQKFSGDFEIHVPSNLESVRMESGGGEISASGISGEVDAETGGGSVHLENIGGSVKAETGGDSIQVGTVGGDLTLETGGGEVSIGSAKGRINASTGGGNLILTSSQQDAVLETGGGNIRVKQCGGKLKVSTGGGNIEVGDVSGPADLETGGGSIRLDSAKGPVRAETGAGRIELNGITSARAETGSGAIVARFVAMNGEHANSVLQTGTGDVSVYLAPNVVITVRAALEFANGHTIRSDFPEIRVITEGGEWGPKTISAEGSLNGGGPTLKVSTSSGDVSFRRSAP